MKPFRKQVAIAIDGGGIRGVVVTRALAMLEKELGKPVSQIFQLTSGTSTGSIISAGIGCGLTASQMYDLYVEMGKKIFCKTWRSFFWPLTRYRYSAKPLESALRQYLGDKVMGDFWKTSPPIDVVITTFDLVENRTRFIKPWKDEYKDWTVIQAVLASCTVPTYFPVVAGQYVDGGVGSYSNPCYLAAYEAQFCLNWDPEETTLISLGTGREPHQLLPGEADHFTTWKWISPLLGAFLHSADDQQVHLVHSFFHKLDFRRFQVDLRQPIEMDDVDKIFQLSGYGEELGNHILHDLTDSSMQIMAAKAPRT
jgi:predicted acylesterase/phospholipase RssA